MINWDRLGLRASPPAVVWAIRLGWATAAYIGGRFAFASDESARLFPMTAPEALREALDVAVVLGILRVVHLVVELVSGLLARHLIVQVDIGRGLLRLWSHAGPVRTWNVRLWPLGIRLSWAVPWGRRFRRLAAVVPVVLFVSVLAAALLLPAQLPDTGIDPRVLAGAISAYLVGLYPPSPVTADASLHSADLLSAGATLLAVDRAGWRDVRALELAIDRDDQDGARRLLAGPEGTQLPPDNQTYFAAQTAPDPASSLAILEPLAEKLMWPRFAELYVPTLLAAVESGQPATALQLERASTAMQVIARTNYRHVVAGYVARFALHQGDPHGAIRWSEQSLGWSRDAAPRAHARMTLAIAYAELGWRKMSAASLARARRRHPTCKRWASVDRRIAETSNPVLVSVVAAAAPTHSPGSTLL